MNWQEVLSLSVVAMVAIIFVKSFVEKKRSEKVGCASGCGCAANKLKTVNTKMQ